MPVSGTTYSANPNSIPVPSYPNPLNNPAAYGTIPNIPMPTATPPTVTGVTAGQRVNAQLPGYNQSLSNVGANIGAETSGQVPQDVINQLQQQAAERGIATGTAGSPAANASYLQALGLTSLGLNKQGQSDLQSILGSLPGASLVSNPAFYPTVGQTQEAQQLRATYGAAPQPQAAAQAGIAATQAGRAAGGAAVPGVPAPSGATSFNVPSFPGYSPTVSGSGANPGWNQGIPSNSTQDMIDQILGTMPGRSTATGTAYDPNDPNSPAYDPYTPTNEEIAGGSLIPTPRYNEQDIIGMQSQPGAFDVGG